jgi:hypothetical protein
LAGRPDSLTQGSVGYCTKLLLHRNALTIGHTLIAIEFAIATRYTGAVGCAVDGVECFFKALVVTVFLAGGKAEGSFIVR